MYVYVYVYIYVYTYIRPTAWIMWNHVRDSPTDLSFGSWYLNGTKHLRLIMLIRWKPSTQQFWRRIVFVLYSNQICREWTFFYHKDTLAGKATLRREKYLPSLCRGVCCSALRCVAVYIYINMKIRTNHTCIYIYMYIYMCVFIYIYVYTYMCVHVYKYCTRMGCCDRF